MGLQVFYSDPPQTDAEKKAAEDAKKNGKSVTDPVAMLDITNYIPSVEWSGDLDSAARKVAFKLAYNTAANDATFQAVLLKLGGFIYVYYDGQQIFSGRLFYVKRNTADYTFDYVAYDDMIFLAKSQVYLKFSNVSITDAIKQVCGEIGIPVADDIPKLDAKVNFIADGKSCTEVFQMLKGESKKKAAAKTTTGTGSHGAYEGNPQCSAIIDAARSNGIDPHIALGMAARETGGDDINEIYMAGNGGLMQITEETAANYGIDSMYPGWRTDYTQNAQAGMYILKQKINEQGGDVWEGVRAYNGSGAAAEQYKEIVRSNSETIPQDVGSGDSATTTTTQGTDETTGGGGEFTVYCKLDKVTLVQKGTLATNDILSDSVQIGHTEHSQSTEDMINRVKSVDDTGNICQVYSIEDDMTHYGTLQAVYKMQNPKDNQGADNVAAAKAQLKRIKEESSLEGLGNINCIAGFCVTVEEQQLKGKFFIKADRHKFENNVHTMNLTLEYMPEQPDTPTIKVENIAAPVFKSSGSKKSSSGAYTGSVDTSQISQNVDAGCNAVDAAQGAYVPDGCVYRVTQAGSYWNPFLKNEYDNSVMGVGRLYDDAQAAGVQTIPYDSSQLEKGDTIVYRTADDSDWAHVGTYDGEGGVWHNSSQEQSWYHQPGSISMGPSEYPAYIIKTSKG